MALPRRLVRVFLSTPSARRATARATSTQHPQVHFYPRPPRGGRRLDAVVDLRPCEFLSTPSARRATRAVIETAQALKNFYPRPPRGGRRRPSVSSLQTCDFYPRPPRGGRRHGFCIKRGKNLFLSTPSARRATHQDCPEKGCNKNFYPRPPRGGRRYLARPERHDLRISIHALREEGDWSGSIRWAQHSHFYPRPPRGGRRILYWFDFTFTEFLSTPSARRATPTHRRMNPPPSYFYPRPPRGGRPIIL